jgi:hypothetical protein
MGEVVEIFLSWYPSKIFLINNRFVTEKVVNFKDFELVLHYIRQPSIGMVIEETRRKSKIIFS